MCKPSPKPLAKVPRERHVSACSSSAKSEDPERQELWLAGESSPRALSLQLVISSALHLFISEHTQLTGSSCSSFAGFSLCCVACTRFVKKQRLMLLKDQLRCTLGFGKWKWTFRCKECSRVVKIYLGCFDLEERFLIEGRMEEGRRRKDDAKSHRGVSETSYTPRGKGGNESFLCPWNVADMREALQSHFCAWWRLALPKERTPPHDPVNLSHDVKNPSSSPVSLFQQLSLEMEILSPPGFR